MTNREFAIGRRLSSTEARAAEGFPHNRTARRHIGQHPVARQRKIYRQRIRIHAETELTIAAVAVFQNVRRRTDVFIDAAAAAGNDALIHMDPAAVIDLRHQVHCHTVQLPVRTILRLFQKLIGMFLEITDSHRIARMHRQRNHAGDLRKIQLNRTIVAGTVTDAQLPIVPRAAMDPVVFFRHRIRLPDRRKACRLRRHHIDAVAEILRKTMDAFPRKLKNLVADKAAVIHRTDQGKRHIMGTDAGLHLSRHMDENHLRLSQVIGLFDQLLHQLAAAFADAHRSKGTIARMRIRAQDHLPAARHHLTVVAVNDGQAWRNIDAAVFMRSTQRKAMIILIDRSPDRTQRIVAVGQNIRHRKLRQTRSTRRLNDVHIRNVMRRQ